MSEKLVIRIAGEPRGKERPKFRNVRTRDGREFIQTYTGQQTQKFEAHLKLAAQDAMGDRRLFEGPLRVCVFAFRSIPASWSKKAQNEARLRIRRPTTTPDADNLMKMLDALNKVVWVDDSQIVDATIRKFYSDTPELVVTVEHAPVPMLETSAAPSAPEQQQLELGSAT
jgi:Holliday junction resolvase RusA-like endonuclease